VTRRNILFWLLAAGLLLAAPARAEHTRFWRQSDYSEFERGTAKGVALRSDGKLMLAPRFAQFSDPNLAYLWALRVDSKGRVYAAGGSNAKALRLDESGKASTVFEVQELLAQALAIDTHDNLYVGTSPDGKVYKVTPEGKSSVFFEPKTKYIWALLFDADGTLYVATGDDGKVFAVGPDGKGQVFFKSEETHARALAFDSKGNLILGTDPNGLVIRVEKVKKPGAALPDAGAAFVLYETAKKEVTALATDRQGNIYASAVGEKAKPAGQAPLSPQGFPSTNVNSMAAVSQQIAALQQQQAPPQTAQPAPGLAFLPSLTGGSEVYRISPEGSPESLWSSKDDLVFALGFSPSGKLLLGTGNHGTVIQLERDGIYSSLAKTASGQVTSFASGAAGTLFLATANPGKVFQLGPGNETDGSYESQTFDAKIFSHWGRLAWWGENGATAGKVSFYVRSGNTSNPEKSWSPWAGPYTDASGESVACPPARFAQWKAVFRAGEGDPTEISWVNLAYLPKNVPPRVDAIVIQDPGIRARGLLTPVQPGLTPVPPVPLRLPQMNPAAAAATAAAASAMQEFQQRSKQQMPVQGFSEKGFQSVVWAASDDNDDDLVFLLYYRGEGEKNWRLLKDRIENRFYSWDTTTMPDGAYVLRVVASDAPSNPPDEALTAERQSDRFEVDNTPPEIRNLRAEPNGGEVRMRFDARDAASALGHASFSLDAADWELVFPAGRLTDARQESYDFVLHNLPPGEHTVAVQAFDRFDNAVTAKVTFVVARQPAR
jgi:WD40 repeat protein